MGRLFEGGLKGFAFIIYWVLAITQFVGIYVYFAKVLDWNSFIAVILSLVTCGIPILGGVLGAFGVHHGWGWSWFSSFALYFGPLLFIILLSVLSAVAERR